MFKDKNFSLWCDYIEREFLNSKFRELIESKIINGATSNPAIFQSAFSNSSAYKSQIESLKGSDRKEIYEALATSDIELASEILMPLYRDGNDGFISIEVDPMLCDDADGTFQEGMRLYEKIAKENVMIKVPATDAGYLAMQKLAKEGVNVNATLIFSLAQAKKTLEALSHLREDAQGVVSIFVSRFDRKLDEILPEQERGKVGIYNATKIYQEIERAESKNIKALFASTGVKGDNYPQSYYIRELMYKNSINTAPLNTIDSFIKEGNFNLKEPVDSYEIDRLFKSIEPIIDMKIIYRGLLSEGLEAFKKSFRSILDTL